MSNLLSKLIGEHCSIINEDGEYLTGSPDIACEIRDMDEEWIKVVFTDPAGHRIVRLERIETLWRISVFEKRLTKGQVSA